MYSHNIICISQVKGEKGETPCSETCLHSGFELIIYDVKTGLKVPGISKTAFDVPSWNEYSEQDTETLFEFAEKFLHKDGCILVTIPDVPKIRSDIVTYAHRYSFTMFREWSVLNDIPLAGFGDPHQKVSFKYIMSLFLSLLSHILFNVIVAFLCRTASSVSVFTCTLQRHRPRSS